LAHSIAPALTLTLVPYPFQVLFTDKIGIQKVTITEKIELRVGKGNEEATGKNIGILSGFWDLFLSKYRA
jgi:hypothetical protein